jgi:hypothetical protein
MLPSLEQTTGEETLRPWLKVCAGKLFGSTASVDAAGFCFCHHLSHSVWETGLKSQQAWDSQTLYHLFSSLPFFPTSTGGNQRQMLQAADTFDISPEV